MTRWRTFWRPSSGYWRGSFWSLVLLTLWLSLVPVDQVPSALHFWDKAQHALGFSGLAFLGLMAYPGRIRVLMLGLVLLGAGIELAQWLTGWRQGDWQDWIADCVGLVMGYFAWRLAIAGAQRRKA
jgi:VanZ family protein